MEYFLSTRQKQRLAKKVEPFTMENGVTYKWDMIID